jgi:hypothetical protein
VKRVQSTSTDSYRQTVLCGDEATYRERCLAYLANHEATDGEAMRALDVKDVNCYRPERTRLFQDGYLKCVGKRVCTVSGRTCKVWTAK